MKSRIINDSAQKTWAVVLDAGEDTAEVLLHFARDQKLSAAQFTGI